MKGKNFATLEEVKLKFLESLNRILLKNRLAIVNSEYPQGGQNIVYWTEGIKN